MSAQWAKAWSKNFRVWTITLISCSPRLWTDALDWRCGCDCASLVARCCSWSAKDYRVKDAAGEEWWPYIRRQKWLHGRVECPLGCMFCHHRAGWGGERHGNTTMSIRAIHIRIGEFPGTCLAAGSPPAMRSISSLRRAQASPNSRPYSHLPGGHPVKALPLPLLKYRTATSAIHHETCQTSGQLSKPAWRAQSWSTLVPDLRRLSCVAWHGLFCNLASNTTRFCTLYMASRWATLRLRTSLLCCSCRKGLWVRALSFLVSWV